MKISIIIPAINESHQISETLKCLQSFRAQDHEVILVDGGSTDNTIELAKAFVDHIVQSEKGRAIQMNAGANQSTGDILLFLHADTLLPSDACSQIIQHAVDDNTWGRFDVRLSSAQPIFRIVESLINIRSRLSSVATGDQAIFVTQKLFGEIGGYSTIPLMEDIVLSKTLRKISKPVCLKSVVLTSSRRWEENGVLKTIILMWWLRLLFFLRVSPEKLSKMYR